MPTYVYVCLNCCMEQEILMSPPAPEQMQHGICDSTGKPCLLKRKWAGVVPGIGSVEGAGFSPARQSISRKK